MLFDIIHRYLRQSGEKISQTSLEYGGAFYRKIFSAAIGVLTVLIV